MTKLTHLLRGLNNEATFADQALPILGLWDAYLTRVTGSLVR